MKYKIYLVGIFFNAILLIIFSLYPPQKGYPQENKSKVKISGVKISPYAKTADKLQDSISGVRQDRSEDLSATIALLRKKIADRPVRYIISKPKPPIHDTVFYIMPNPIPDIDYLPAEIEPAIYRDTIIIIQKQPNLFQRIFKHKKPKQ